MIASIRRNAPPPPFPGNSTWLASATQQSALSLARVAVDVVDGGVFEASMPADDAYIVLFQLSDYPSHEFRSDGKLCQVPALSKFTLNIIDLKGEPIALLRHPVDSLFFHIPRAALDEIAEESGSRRIDTLAAPAPWNTYDPIVKQLYPLFVDALSATEPGNRLLYDHLMLAVAGHVASTYGGMRPRTGSVRGGLAPWQERRAKELLATDLGAELSLQQIAQECTLSVGYFARAFKKTAGISPHAWRQLLRIENAKKLLLASPASLADAAAASGFADQSHFHRVFVQHTGVTPGAWRRTLRDA